MNAARPRDAQRRARNRAIVDELVRAPAGDRDVLLEELVRENMEVASSVARRYTGRSGFGPDLEQVAHLALVRAAQQFDATRESDFLAYAIPCVAGAVKRYFRDSAWVVRPPRPVQQRHVEEQGRTDHIAHGVDIETCFRPWSLDVVVPGSAASLGDGLVDDDRTWERAEARLMLAPHLRALAPRAKRILHLRFVEERTQQEIGDELGLSQMQVSRLLNRHLDELRRAMDAAA